MIYTGINYISHFLLYWDQSSVNGKYLILRLMCGSKEVGEGSWGSDPHPLAKFNFFNLHYEITKNTHPPPFK